MNINKYNLNDLKTAKNIIYMLNDKLEFEKRQNVIYIGIIESLGESIEKQQKESK